jgi:hypothetical protein
MEQVPDRCSSAAGGGFIKTNNLEKSMRDKDWLHIARTYNGKKQRGYDERLKKKYDALTAGSKEKEGNSVDQGNLK